MSSRGRPPKAENQDEAIRRFLRDYPEAVGESWEDLLQLARDYGYYGHVTKNQITSPLVGPGGEDLDLDDLGSWEPPR